MAPGGRGYTCNALYMSFPKIAPERLVRFFSPREDGHLGSQLRTFDSERNVMGTDYFCGDTVRHGLFRQSSGASSGEDSPSQARIPIP